MNLSFTEKSFIFGLVLSIIVAIISAAVFAYNKKRNTTISNESPRLKALRQLNSGFSFSPFYSWEYSKTLDSKQQFDRFDPENYLMGVLYESSDEYERWIDTVEQNEGLYREYKEGLADIPESEYEKESWRKAESKLFEKEKLQLGAPPTVTIEWSYVSPAGRNHYYDDEVYTVEEVKVFLEESLAAAKKRSSRQARIRHERALMTDSLRYDVLKRDNFTCQICGSTAQDGVKLEVDHIIPVSRGGRTEMSNLQTLCERCNRGKRDKV